MQAFLYSIPIPYPNTIALIKNMLKVITISITEYEKYIRIQYQHNCPIGERPTNSLSSIPSKRRAIGAEEEVGFKSSWKNEMNPTIKQEKNICTPPSMDQNEKRTCGMNKSQLR